MTAPATDSPSLQCPLCGGANACRMARGGSREQPCWCEKEGFSAALLARLPEGRKGESCICKRCVESQ
jgi:hypothetical protein